MLGNAAISENLKKLGKLITLPTQIKMRNVKRGGPLDNFFHGILPSHWFRGETWCQMLSSDWRRRQTLQIMQASLEWVQTEYIP